MACPCPNGSRKLNYVIGLRPSQGVSGVAQIDGGVSYPICDGADGLSVEGWAFPSDPNTSFSAMVPGLNGIWDFYHFSNICVSGGMMGFGQTRTACIDNYVELNENNFKSAPNPRPTASVRTISQIDSSNYSSDPLCATTDGSTFLGGYFDGTSSTLNVVRDSAFAAGDVVTLMWLDTDGSAVQQSGTIDGSGNWVPN